MSRGESASRKSGSSDGINIKEESVGQGYSWGGLGWQPAESIGQWVSFGEGRFDSTTRFLTRSLERGKERSAVEVLRREFYLFDRSRTTREHYVSAR